MSDDHRGVRESSAAGPHPALRLRLRRCGAVLALALAVLAPGAAPAQTATPLSAGDKSVANYAFATQLGSGIYTIDGRTVQIYRLPLSYTVREETEERWGLKVTFPVTIGFYDFEAIDVIDTGLPDNLDTVSLVPGVEFRVPVGHGVLLKPFLEAGVAREGSEDLRTYVSSCGLRTHKVFHEGGFDIDLGNALLYARVDPADGAGLADDYGAFHASTHARHRMGASLAGRELDWGLYASVEMYLDEPDFPLPGDGSWKLSDQYEVGATLGTWETVKLWKIKLPRLGIGYRFGSDASAIRFVIGTPAPSLKR